MNSYTQVKIKVLAFGSLVDLIGSSAFEIACEPSFNAFKMVLLEKFPALKEQHFAYAYHRKIIDSEISLENHAEIALLPPFSGG